MQGAGLPIGNNSGLSVLLKDTWTGGAEDRSTNPGINERLALPPETQLHTKEP